MNETHHITEAAAAGRLGTILGIWAHPDDEAYLAAGLMTLAVEAGSQVVCVTATRGEHGTTDPDLWPPERLARTREHELAASMAVLGVDNHRLLDYEDGTLADQEQAAGAAAIEEIVLEAEPDTIVTFGPDGMTGHPDHRTISAWTTRAWQRAGQPCRLLYAATTTAFVDEYADLHESLGIFGGGLPIAVSAGDTAVSVHLDDTLLDRKLAALRAQATQTHTLIDTVGEERFRSWWRNETFRHCAVGRSVGILDGGQAAGLAG